MLVAERPVRRRRAVDWLVLYPRRRGLWPGEGPAGPVLYDPQQRRGETADPRRDSRLPALAEWLEVGRLVAYRPGVRAVVRVEPADRPWYLKLARPERLARTQTAEELIWDAIGGRGVVRAAALFHGAAAYPAAAGVSLHSRLGAGVERADLEAAGRLVAALHTAPVPAGLAPVNTYSLEDWAGWARQHDPTCPDWLPARAIEIGRSVPEVEEEPVLTHGDLHDKNLFVGPDDARFIDVGSAGIAPPSDDVGMLAAHIVLRAVQQGRPPAEGHAAARVMLGAYRRAGGPATARAVTARTTATLARLACLYRLRRNWHRITPVLLEAATGVRV